MEKAIKQSSDRTSDVEARQTFESEVLSKLGSLSAGLKSEYTLSEQVAELREMKATIRERLQASEIALADARQHCLGLQQKEQLLMQRVSSLEVEAATLRSQSRDSPDAMLREQELKDKNTQLQVDITQAQKDASEAADRSQGQERSLAEQQEQIDCLNTQLEEMQASLTTLHEEKSTSEEQAAARYDDIRDQVLKAATMEKTKLSNEHANRLHQLKQQKNKVDSQVEELSRQLADLKTAEGNKVCSLSTLSQDYIRLTLSRARRRVNSGPNLPIWRFRMLRKTNVLLLCKKRSVRQRKLLSPRSQRSRPFLRQRPDCRERPSPKMQRFKPSSRPRPGRCKSTNQQRKA